jgi:predicted RecB family nuclease
VRLALLTPSKITAWLDCPHYLTLRRQVDEGLRAEPKSVFGSFAELLLAKGLAHEQDCLAEYAREGKSILHVPAKDKGESFSSWASRAGNPFDGGWDVVYQMPFVDRGIRGVADFVVRVQDPVTGAVSYEPVDAKLTRADAKPGHMLQLCFYADAIEALTRVRPQHMHIWLGSGHLETLRIDDFHPLWRRLRGRLGRALAAGPSAETVPEPCGQCPFCEFSGTCEQQWRDEDSLIYVAGMRKPDIAALAGAEIATLAGLATADDPVDGLTPQRLTRLRGQALLQLTARDHPDDPPPYVVIEPGEDQWGRGLETLPEPDVGDVFLDFEGHPFWRADTGLFFLVGLLVGDSTGQWQYRDRWAHDLGQEADAVAELIDYLARRRHRFPGMHVYHYNHTERSALQRLAETYGVGEIAMADLTDTGAFIDLLLVARNSIQAGTESYGLKHLERLTEFERRHTIDRGVGAVVQYERYMTESNQGDLDAVAAHNEDDVRATLALRDWLIAHRPPDMAWRHAHIQPDPDLPELNESIARLHGFGAGSVEHTLGDLLGYWRDEWFAYIAPKKAKLDSDPIDLLNDPEVIADLSCEGLVERTGKTGKPVMPAMRFSFPAQDLDRFPRTGSAGMVLLASPDGQRLTTDIVTLNRQSGLVDLKWTAKLHEAGFLPRAAVMHDWVETKVKSDALQRFADDVLEGRAANPVTLALLRRDLPRFAGTGPARGVFVDDLHDMTTWVTQLDESYVAIQGPPGTGKTYRAARLIPSLVRAGYRVGVTAVSHHAIANVLDGVVEAFRECGDLDLLRAVCKSGATSTRQLTDVRYVRANDDCARADFNVVAGTTWLFCSSVMQASPVDVLLIDEAGQLALADALAASTAARNLLLVGDPLQLPQVAHANHPGISGRSVLDHVVDGDATVPDDRGVFLGQTRRMHPEVCWFISDRIYEGRLHSHPDCQRQSTVAGTGLRWMQAGHQGNRTYSTQEADLIADELSRLIGSGWTNQKGEHDRLRATDFMVVAPYNDQVNTIKGRLEREPRLADIPVGTVDKFQGREAAVVFFSMATSSGEDMTRGVDFLFSRNRLNVAVSRARCLAYLVCTDELLNTRARTVEDMRLIATLNAFVEAAEQQVGRQAHGTAPLEC